MKKISMLCVLVWLSGCTHVQVNPVDSDENKISFVCIKNNPKVIVGDFLSVVQNSFLAHGIDTSVYESELPEDCIYSLTYTAERGWDISPYLDFAELRLKKGRTTIGTATYRHSGGFALNKWASTESKMAPVIDDLLKEF